MSHDNDNSENKKKHLNYAHKSEAEFDAWQTRIVAVAGEKKCKRMLLKGEHDDPKVRAKSETERKEELADANETVWDLLMKYITDDAVVKTLTRLFADNDNLVYKGHDAFMYLKNHWKDASTYGAVERRRDDYDKAKVEKLSEWPEDQDIEAAFDELSELKDALEGTDRSIDELDFCRDLKGLFYVCHENVCNKVDGAWDKLTSAGTQQEPLKVQKALRDAAGEATARERQRDASRPGKAMSVKGATASSEYVTKADMQQAINEAAKQAFAAGMASNGAPRKEPPFGTGGGHEECNYCKKKHFVNTTKDGERLCWDNAEQADKHDFAAMPPKIREAAHRFVLKAVLKAKPDGGGAGAPAFKKKVAFMVRPNGKVEGSADGNCFKLNVDSAAIGGHYFTDTRLFPNGVDRTKVSRVQVANDVYAAVAGQGTAMFECKDGGGEWTRVEIQGAYLMEGPWSENLFSVGMARDRGCLVQFGTRDAPAAVTLIAPDGTDFPILVTKLGDGCGEAYHLEVRAVPETVNKAFLSQSQVPHTRGLSKEMHASDTEKVEIWTARMGHISSERLRHLPVKTVGAPKILSKLEARKGTPDVAKMLANFPKGLSMVNKAGPQDGEWANDIWKAPCKGVLTGAQYVDFFWGIGNSLVIGYPMQFKSQHPTFLLRFYADVAQLSSNVKVLKIQPDCEAVLNSGEVQSICDKRGTVLMNSAEYEPWSNPAENACRLIPAIARSLEVACGAPEKYWEVTIAAGWKVHNRAPGADGRATPFELIGVGVPSVAAMKVIGCRAVARVPVAKRANKMDNQGVESTCWGEATYKLGWKFQAIKGPNAGKWFTTSQAVFFETQYPMLEESKAPRSIGGKHFDDDSDEDDDDDDAPLLVDADGVSDDEESEGEPDLDAPSDDDEGGDEMRNQSTVASRIGSRQSVQTNPARQVAGVLTDEHARTANPHAGTRRNQVNEPMCAMRAWREVDTKHLEMTYADLVEGPTFDTTGWEEASTNLKAMSASGVARGGEEIDMPDVPFKPSDISNFSAEDQARCEAAREKEWNNLKESETFGEERKPIKDLKAAGINVLGMGETLKVKRDGTVKDRAYVLGCCQWDSMFDLTYAPVISSSCFRFFLAIAAVYCTVFKSVDFVAAYTQSLLPTAEQVWVRFPKPWRQFDKYGNELAGKLQRSLYGLKQAGKNWYDKLSGWLINYGFKQCFSEPCLYILRVGTFFVIVGTYVDDCPFGSNCAKLLDQVIEAMIADGLRLTCEEGLYDMLGAEIMHTPDCLILHNTKYLKNVFDKYMDDITKLMDKARKKEIFNVPCLPDTAKKVREAKDNKGKIESDPMLIKMYQRLIGILLYAAVLCNPDALYSVCLLSQANHCPTPELYDCAMHVMVYLYMRGAMGIPFWRHLGDSTVRGLFQPGQDVVRALFDASWEVVRSTSGWAIFVNGSLVAYGSKRQASIALSSNAAEIMAASIACLDIVQLRNLLADFGYKQKDPSTMLGDSLGAKCLADNPVSKGLAKHIERRELYVRELTKLGVVRVYHVGTDFNLSDMFTKALGEAKLTQFRDVIMVPI